MGDAVCGGTFFSEKSSPTPLQKSTHKKHQKKIPKIRTDGRREGKPRFGCREQSGTAKTLPVKRVVVKQCGPSGRPVPTRFVFFVGTGVLDGPFFH